MSNRRYNGEETDVWTLKWVTLDARDPRARAVLSPVWPTADRPGPASPARHSCPEG